MWTKFATTLFCYVTQLLLNHQNIDGLSDTWKNINTILNKIASLKTTASDNHSKGINFLVPDIAEVLGTIEVQRSCLEIVISYISEIDKLMKRLNIVCGGGDGVKIHANHRKNLFNAKALLMNDKSDVKKLRRR